MGMSDRRKAARAKRKALQQARMKNPGKDSVYARKQRGIYPPRSPYLTGDWGKPQVIEVVFRAEPVSLLEAAAASVGRLSW